MKITFSPGFYWDNYCAGITPGSFEAESIDEVCDKVKEIMQSDVECYTSEDFSLEGYSDEDESIDFEFQYDVKLRRNNLHDEEKQMFKQLRKALKEELFTDEA